MRRFGRAILAALLCAPSFVGTASAESGRQRIVAAFGGDVLTPKDAGLAETRAFLSGLAPTFRAADIGFVNLEGPIGGRAEEAKRCGSPQCHLLRQSQSAAIALAEIGVSVVSVANNHALDMGRSGIAATDAALAQAGVLAAGRAERQPVSLERNGMRLAFLAYAAHRSGPDFRDVGRLAAEIKAAAGRFDAVIVSLHAGCEGEHAGPIPNGSEKCFGEDRGDVRSVAAAAVAAGAALVIGHGPHVPRGTESVAGVPVLYSLGNLATARGIRVEGRAGLAPVALVSFVRNADGKVVVDGVRIRSFKQSFGNGPRRDPEEAALNEIRTLSGKLPSRGG
jgi:poly-gamma-glutamate capsule biosynthesis protein CapA/YwtB (metallophosphatase superfamily)